MHDRLRMNQDLNLIGTYTEQPMRLDDLEALIHQRRRIDGDLPSHLPCRMTQRLIGRDPLQVRRRQVSERSAGRGEYEPTDFALVSSVQTLVDGIVLAINWKDRDVMFPCRGRPLARC